MASTVLLWCLLLAVILQKRVLTHCADYTPNDYETWTGFQIFAGLYVWLPLLLPALMVVLLAEAFLPRKESASRKVSSAPR